MSSKQTAQGFNGAASCGTRKATPPDHTDETRTSFNGAASCGTRKGVGACAILSLELGFNGAASCGTRKASWSISSMGRTWVSFNGAASCGTRKGVAGRACPEGGYRFNGAASCGTRKAAILGHIQVSIRASMGPRLVGRGKARPVKFRFRICAASMGPRLVGRGKQLGSSNYTLASTRLQWGRVLWDAESMPDQFKHRVELTASMGPRLVGRGKKTQKHQVAGS